LRNTRVGVSDSIRERALAERHALSLLWQDLGKIGSSGNGIGLTQPLQDIASHTFVSGVRDTFG